MPEEEARRAESEFITIEVIMEDGRPGEKVTRARHRHGTIPGTLDGRRPTRADHLEHLCALCTQT